MFPKIHPLAFKLLILLKLFIGKMPPVDEVLLVDGVLFVAEVILEGDVLLV